LDWRVDILIVFAVVLSYYSLRLGWRWFTLLTIVLLSFDVPHTSMFYPALLLFGCLVIKTPCPADALIGRGDILALFGIRSRAGCYTHHIITIKK
jgi:hypothetical protein